MCNLVALGYQCSTLIVLCNYVLFVRVFTILEVHGSYLYTAATISGSMRRMRLLTDVIGFLPSVYATGPAGEKSPVCNRRIELLQY